MFLLVLAHPGSPRQRAIKWLLLFSGMVLNAKISWLPDSVFEYVIVDVNLLF